MSVEKARLLSHLRTLLQGRVDTADEAITSTRSAFANDTKSSAGDKHEVGRAMVQQELDKLEEQRAKLIVLQQELERISLERDHDHVDFGALVTTDQGVYFISIGLGPVDVDGANCYVISLASPIGQGLKGKRVGEQIHFNGRTITIAAIA